MKKAYLKNGLILLGIMLVIACYSIFFAHYVTFENIKRHQHALQRFVTDHYLRSVVVYLIGYIGAIGLSLPIGAMLTLLGGALFGVFWGGIYALIGATTGATLAFLLVRFVIGNSLQRHYHKQLKALNKELAEQGAYYVLSLRFFAIIPFFLVNILAGLSTLSVRTFMLTTIVGILPGTFAYAYAGDRIAQIDTAQDILSPSVLLAFMFLGMLALLPILVRKKKRHEN